MNILQKLQQQLGNCFCCKPDSFSPLIKKSFCLRFAKKFAVIQAVRGERGVFNSIL